MKQDMRIQITKRLLKEGLIRSMAKKPVSRISVSELCKEAGVNRATFYNHYESPTALLKDIAEDYALNLRTIYRDSKQSHPDSEETAILACLRYLYGRKDEIKMLFSPNAENNIMGFGLNSITERLMADKEVSFKNPPVPSDDYYLYVVITASAAYGLFKVWLTKDIDKTPEEILNILVNTFKGTYF